MIEACRFLLILALPLIFHATILDGAIKERPIIADAPKLNISRLAVNEETHALDQSWQSGFVLPPGLDGTVLAIATVGNDLYVGGQFEKAGDLILNGIGRWDGTNWHSVSGGVGGSVYALAIAGTNLYVGGEFDTAGGIGATNLACWTGSEWRAIGHVTGRDFNSFAIRVTSLLVDGPRLFVAGAFREVSGVAATNIAKWDGTNWSPLGSGIGSRGGLVGSLAKIGSRLYAGGLFFNAGDLLTTNIAYWNGKRWRPLTGGISGGLTGYRLEGQVHSGIVQSLAVHRGRLLVGGDFSRVGRLSVTNLARWNGHRWNRVASVGTVNAVNGIAAVLTRGREIYVTGIFNDVNGIAATNIARWNGRAWTSLGNGVNGQGYCLAFFGNDLFLGGDFGVASGASVANITRWNSQSWSPLGEGIGNTIMGIPTSIAVSGQRVFVAGHIHTAGTNAVHNVASWDGTNWSSLGSGIPAIHLSASAASGSNYYVAGFFTLPDVGATNIACWNGTEWRPLGGGLWMEDTPGQISAMAADGNLLYVAGAFTSAGGVPATNVAVWNGFDWTPIGNLKYADNPAILVAVAARAGEIYAGGISGQLGYEDFVVQWDGSNWGSRWARPFLGADVSVRTLGFARDRLYALGRFVEAPDIAATNLAEWNGTNWSAAGHPFTSEDEVRSVAGTVNYVYVAGSFTNAAGNPVNGVAAYDGNNWFGLGSGLVERDGRGHTTGLAASGDKVYAIGHFKTAGGKPSYRFAEWREPF